METIETWYTNLDPTLRVYWTIALTATLIFAIQTALTMIGIGETDADADMGGMDTTADAHGDTLDTGGAIQLFTIRNLINFLLGVGWGGVCLWRVIPNRALLSLAALLCGLLFVAAFLLMLRQLMRLEKNGNFRISDCVGLVGSVYVRIPTERIGMGKVQLSLRGSVQEFDALTDGPPLPSGTKVRVKDSIDSHTLLVERL